MDSPSSLQYQLTIAFVSGAHQRTTELLTRHRESVEKVAQLLLKKEVITRYVEWHTF